MPSPGASKRDDLTRQSRGLTLLKVGDLQSGDLTWNKRQELASAA
jgi:hypothetical protein